MPEFRAELTEAGTRAETEHTRRAHTKDLFKAIYVSHDLHHIIHCTHKPGLPLTGRWRTCYGTCRKGAGKANGDKNVTHASVILVQPFRFNTSIFLQFCANVLY